MKQSVYIFDVDGVLNDLKKYQPDDRIIAQIVTLLETGVFVAINTGRGYDWVEENVVQPIRHKLRDPEATARFFVAVEMGGLGVEYKNGMEHKTPSAFSLTQDQIGAVRQVLDEHPEYADRVHWYGKESMATIDKNPTTTMEAFRPIQEELTEVLRVVFRNQHVKVANSNDAIDVHAPEAGKWAGAQLIYEWLRRTTDIRHDHFVCFGDSIVDYEMARFFAAQSHNTDFVFTGPIFENVTEDASIRLVKTEQPYREGTYEYLKNSAYQAGKI